MKTLSIPSRALGALVISISLAACASKKAKPLVDRGALQRDWAITFRELGLVPTFPPREDFLVGDIYVSAINPNSEEVETILEKSWDKLTKEEKAIRVSLGMDTRAVRLDLSKELSTAYSSTLSAPVTTTEFNSILGNPALAAAEAEVSKISEEIKQLEATVDAAEKKNTDAIKAHTTATQTKARLDASVAATKAELVAAESKPVDIAAEEAAVIAIQEKIWGLDQQLIDAKFEQAQAGADVEKKKAADLKVADLERQKSRSAIEQTKASADLTRAKAKKADTTALKQKVDDLVAQQTAQNDEVLKLDHAKSNAALDLKALQDTTAPKKAALTAKKTQAETTRTAIGAAGSRLLYPEPTFGNENIFSAKALPEKDTTVSEAARVNRLRLVAFPEFSVISLKAADLSAFVPIEALGLGLNLSSESLSQISVKIPAAESYAISLADLYDKIIEARGNKAYLSLEAGRALKGALLTDFAFAGNKPKVPFIYLRVATEVFYARAIDVSLVASKSRGARLSVNSPTKDSEGKTSEKGYAPAATPEVSTLLGQIAGRLATEQLLPGGSIQLISKNESSIGLRRVFDRPVAIGWRGLVLKVTPQGEVVDVTTDTSRVPLYNIPGKALD